MGKRESGIQTRTMDRLIEEFKPHIIVRCKHGTAFAVKGDPDIYGCVSWSDGGRWRAVGRMFAFEIKNEDGTVTKIQTRRLKEFMMAGAITGVIDSPDLAVKIIRQAAIR
jgi:hypothetical protein